MFERYGEKARRVIFFARYEASIVGSPYIQPEHLLLGLLREDKSLALRLLSTDAAYEAIREQIEARTTKREKISTSVDLPFDADSKRVLACAAEEAPASGQISTTHLLLGILHLETSFAAEILCGYGLSLDAVRQEMLGAESTGSVKRSQAKPTACRDCKHLIMDGPTRRIDGMNLFCGASPKMPQFDCYTGELTEVEPGAPPSQRFHLCLLINFGECDLFDPKKD
jgi:ATP-dependent Clp protease ATP-binding subunit ClpC